MPAIGSFSAPGHVEREMAICRREIRKVWLSLLSSQRSKSQCSYTVHTVPLQSSKHNALSNHTSTATHIKINTAPKHTHTHTGGHSGIYYYTRQGIPNSCPRYKVQNVCEISLKTSPNYPPACTDGLCS